MDLSPLFCSGLELGKLVESSGLLLLSWNKISEIHGSIDLNQEPNLRFQIYQETKYTVVAFLIPPINTRRFLKKNDGSLNSVSTRLEGSRDSNPFHFLCSAKISSFSLHKLAFQLFASALNDFSALKSQLLSSEKPLIITGLGLGGSVASLFTLWLLDTIEPGKQCPLCITFGSPLIGDASLQQILENSARNSCFLNIMVPQDLVPNQNLLIPQESPQAATIFKPFGSFLFYFDFGCICIEDPDGVLELLYDVNKGQNFGDWRTYGKILQRMDKLSVLMGASEPASNWLLGAMFFQPGQTAKDIQDDPNTRVVREVITRMEDRAMKKQRFDPFKKLNKMKILMAELEWYKKKCRMRGIGYYDHFRNQATEVDVTVEKYVKELSDYWKSMVEEAEKKPQSDIAVFKRRFLFAGNTYRRMIEPLEIAGHYRKGLKNYRATGRAPHYVLLQRWFEQVTGSVRSVIRSARQASVDFLTVDSCFWAEVEEAMIVIKSLKNSETRKKERKPLMIKLDMFEKYVWEQIKNHLVSSEIFLEESSFMKWWREYKTVKGLKYTSSFTKFMNNGEYIGYEKYIQKEA